MEKRVTKYLKWFLPLTGMLLLLAACGGPVPEDKKAYIGEWTSPKMYLRIDPDGKILYKRTKPGREVSIEAPLQKFEGDHFKVGIAFLSTIFVVSSPPHKDFDSNWKMVVDGVELTKTPDHSDLTVPVDPWPLIPPPPIAHPLYKDS
jgi:hypothetical protein